MNQAFVKRHSAQEYTLRYFTPKAEVELCGHATMSDIMIPLPDLNTLQTLQPDMEAISVITRTHNAVSFHVFAFSNDGYTAHVRDFAPLYDIPEESATGTVALRSFYFAAARKRTLQHKP